MVARIRSACLIVVSVLVLLVASSREPARLNGDASPSVPASAVRADPRVAPSSSAAQPPAPRSPASPSASQTVALWDNADSHKWIAEPSWGDPISVDWTERAGRRLLRAVITPTLHSWAAMRTDAFPAEDREPYTGLRADVYQEGGAPGIDLKLEVRGPRFDSPDLIQSIDCADLPRDAWTTCTWQFSSAHDYSQVAHLSLIYDRLAGTPVRFYVDDVRLVGPEGERVWDDTDDGSRAWFYFGNWFNWNPSTPFGLEPITHNGGNQTSRGSLSRVGL